MDSTYEQRCDAVITTIEEVPVTMVDDGNASPAAPPMQAPVMAPAAPVNENQHSLVRAGRGIVLSQRGMSFDGMPSDSSLVSFEEYKHGDLDCQGLYYHGGTCLLTYTFCLMIILWPLLLIFSRLKLKSGSFQ